METDKQGAPRGRAWYFAFLVSWIGILVIPFYNATQPSLGGFPLFYWYQLALVVVGAVITWLVHVMTFQAHDES